MQPNLSDVTEKVWVWTNDGTDLYFDRNERVRFRVEEEIWTDLAPGDEPPTFAQGPQDAVSAPPGPRTTTVSDEQGTLHGRVHQEMLSAEQKKQMRAWRIVGSMQQGGLGLVSWWDNDEEQAEEDGGEEVGDGEGEQMATH